MTDRPAEPMPGAEPSDLQEGEPTVAPSPGGTEGSQQRESSGFGDAAGEMSDETEVEAQVEGDHVAGNDPGTAEEQDGQTAGQDEDTEVDELAQMKGSLADLTNDLQRLPGRVRQLPQAGRPRPAAGGRERRLQGARPR